MLACLSGLDDPFKNFQIGQQSAEFGSKECPAKTLHSLDIIGFNWS
jgi:hypothetical protein